jgi:hypothetical protein
MHRGTLDWEELTQNFKITFNFVDESLFIDAAVQVIIGKKFMDKVQVEIVPICSAHRESMPFHKLLECYNVTEEDQEKEDPRNV